MAAKKKSKIEKPKRGRGRPASGRVIKIPGKFHGQDPRVEFHAPPKEDLEKILPPPNDAASKLKYPPPKKHPIFRAKWSLFVDSITRRESFHVGHLENLAILCDLYVERDDLMSFIRANGRTYCSIGRQGEVWKPYPEVLLVSKAESSIKEYSKMLGLLPKKDHGTESGGEGEEWK